MYNLNINFLKDRKLDAQTSDSLARKKQTTPINERIPIVVGAAVGAAFVVASVASLLVINQQTASTKKEIAVLESEINRLQGQNEEVEKLQAQITQIKQNTEALVSVFKNIKPWSSLLEEISLVIPPTVQIKSIQSRDKNLTFTGIASSYDDVNDFVLTLKKSRFLDSQETALTKSNYGNNPNSVQFPEQSQGRDSLSSEEQPIVTLPEIVSFSITTKLSDIPASELINELNRRGAIGLVNRIRTLEKKGIIQP